MSLLGRLAWRGRAKVIAAALSEAPRGVTVVVGPVALARALGVPEGATALGVLASRTSRVARRDRGGLVRAEVGAPPFTPGAAAAVVLTGPADAALVATWLPVVAAGGVLVVVSPQTRETVSALALNGGLVDLEQRQLGRTVVTSGRRPSFA